MSLYPSLQIPRFYWLSPTSVRQPAQGDIFPILWKYLVEEWKQNEPDSYKLQNLRAYFHQELLELREGESSELFAIDRHEYIRAEAQRLKELKSDHITFFARCWRHYRSQ